MAWRLLSCYSIWNSEPAQVATGDISLNDPRASFSGHALETPWFQLDRLYVTRYGMWNCLTTPFLLVQPGFERKEIKPDQANGETWRCLPVKFPPRVPRSLAEANDLAHREGSAQGRTIVRLIGRVQSEYLAELKSQIEGPEAALDSGSRGSDSGGRRGGAVSPRLRGERDRAAALLAVYPAVDGQGTARSELGVGPREENRARG